MAKDPPLIGDWMRDVAEWAVAEEVHMKQTRRDDKIDDDLRA